MTGRRRLALATGATLVALAGGALAQGMDFMPDGGRTLAMDVLADASGGLAEIAGMEQDAAAWLDYVTERAPDLGEAQRLTLAEYLAANMPLDAPDELSGLEGEALGAALPRDGKDLAVANCQSCHSLFTGYLTHDRDAAGWEATFKSPFHTEIPMDAVQIRTFATYSEHNMPLSFDEVPPEWRF